MWKNKECFEGKKKKNFYNISQKIYTKLFFICKEGTKKVFSMLSTHLPSQETSNRKDGPYF